MMDSLQLIGKVKFIVFCAKVWWRKWQALCGGDCGIEKFDECMAMNSFGAFEIIMKSSSIGVLLFTAQHHEIISFKRNCSTNYRNSLKLAIISVHLNNQRNYRNPQNEYITWHASKASNYSRETNSQLHWCIILWDIIKYTLIICK